MTAPIRILTTADRARMDALCALGVYIATGLGVVAARTTLRVTVRGNTYPIAAELRRWGFTSRGKGDRRVWTAHGDLDLATLLPGLIAAHHAHERQSEVTRAGVCYLPRPAPVPRDELSIAHGCEPSAAMVEARECVTARAVAR
jgi:hypothetical protein